MSARSARDGAVVGAFAALLAICYATVARAQSEQADRGTVARLAGTLAERSNIAGATEGTIAVGVACDVSGAPRGAELAAALSWAIRARIAEQAPRKEVAVVEGASREPAELGAGSATRRSDRLLLHVLVSMQTRMVVADLTVLRATADGPTAVRPPRANVLRRASVRHPLDAELAGFLGAPPTVRRERIRARRAALPGASYLAVAATDLDHDGTVELLLLSRDRVDALRVSRTRRGALRVASLASASLASLTRAPARPRRAIGTIAASADGSVGRTSDHATPFAVRFDGSALSVEARAEACPEGAYPLDGDATCASPVLGRDYFHAELVAAPHVPSAPAPHPAPAGFYARAARSLAQRDGPPLDAEAIVTPRGRLVLSLGERRGALPDVGAALAIADLDADGTLEILTSAPSAVGEGDQLTLRSWRRALGTVYRSPPLGGSVLVAASADLDGDGAEELLAIEEPADANAMATLWVIE